MSSIIISVIISLGVCILTGPFLIPLLRKLKFGQSILEIGPQWHAKKAGTPTIGGIIFIIAIIISTFFTARESRVIVLLLTAIAFGIIGFIDDYIKVVLKRNLGLTATQKFTAQTVVAVAFVAYLYYLGFVDGVVYIPFFSVNIELAWWLYIPFTVFVVLATVNSVNLTDGLDGLASSITVVVSIFFTLIAFSINEISVAAFAASVTGGCLGFLLFNAYPAKVFMGDTGSLFLGGAISAIAIALKLPLLLVIVGGVFLVETLSVIIQVLSFKLTGKRVFKMAPIHHHFEMVGWKETRVVMTFLLATIVLCIVGYIGIIGIIN